MNEGTLPEGFVKMVDCCRFCVHCDVLTNHVEIANCQKHNIVVYMFSKCPDFED